MNRTPRPKAARDRSGSQGQSRPHPALARPVPHVSVPRSAASGDRRPAAMPRPKVARHTFRPTAGADD